MERVQDSRNLSFYSFDLVDEKPYWSPNIYGLLGYTNPADAPVFHSLSDLFHHGDREKVQALWDTAHVTGENFNCTARIVCQDGRLLTCTAQGSTVTDAQGHVTHIFGHIHPENP
ncbi:PAS domain-containing protein [Rhodobacteraceae bacterium M385]|nr:PAS domain-containing protein [Rhodobacteraceae bacterium M385]